MATAVDLTVGVTGVEITRLVETVEIKIRGATHHGIRIRIMGIIQTTIIARKMRKMTGGREILTISKGTIPHTISLSRIITIKTMMRMTGVRIRTRARMRMPTIRLRTNQIKINKGAVHTTTMTRIGLLT
jgi:hypothetical protein